MGMSQKGLCKERKDVTQIPSPDICQAGLLKHTL